MTFPLQWPDGLGGLPGVTPHTKFDFLSISDGLSFVCFSNLKNVDGIMKWELLIPSPVELDPSSPIELLLV